MFLHITIKKTLQCDIIKPIDVAFLKYLIPYLWLLLNCLASQILYQEHTLFEFIHILFQLAQNTALYSPCYLSKKVYFIIRTKLISISIEISGKYKNEETG